MAFYPCNVNSNSGGQPPVLLWTNSSPTTPFSSQTISLNLSNYNAVIVEFTGGWRGDGVVSKALISMNAVNDCFGGYSSDFTAFSVRKISVATSGVIFGNASSASSTFNSINLEADNSFCIPTKIYGVNLQM